MLKTDIQDKQKPIVFGSFVSIGGQDFYQILNYDQMPPFLMSIVSSSDHWMYVSSTGGLTAGRIRAENCLFPYDTEDKMHDCHRHTGPVTLIRYREEASDWVVWQPFNDNISDTSSRTRRLLKHVAGDEVIFEEKHEPLGLIFRYSWRNSSEYGFIRTATLENCSQDEIEVEILDGLQNIWPGGVSLATYQNSSCLVDAYKHNELDPLTGWGFIA